MKIQKNSDPRAGACRRDASAVVTAGVATPGAWAARVFLRVLSHFTPFLTNFKPLTHELSAKHDKEHQNGN